MAADRGIERFIIKTEKRLQDLEGFDIYLMRSQRRVVNGEAYQIGKSQQIHVVKNTTVINTLLRTRNGSYFLNRQFKEQPYSFLVIFTPEQALTWLLNYMDKEDAKEALAVSPPTVKLTGGPGGQPITLRLSQAVVAEVDAFATAENVSRSRWMELAILEKLARDKKRVK